VLLTVVEMVYAASKPNARAPYRALLALMAEECTWTRMVWVLLSKMKMMMSRKSGRRVVCKNVGGESVQGSL
jgi:hypothetical protein